jgi:hypothetical protein
MASTIHLMEKICVAKCEEENGQIIIIQGIAIAIKTCVVFNIIVKKINLKHPNLTSQILPECTSKSGRICINYLCLAPYSSKYYHP